MTTREIYYGVQILDPASRLRRIKQEIMLLTLNKKNYWLTVFGRVYTLLGNLFMETWRH